MNMIEALEEDRDKLRDDIQKMLDCTDRLDVIELVQIAIEDSEKRERIYNLERHRQLV